MSGDKQGTFAKVEGYLGRVYVAIPLLALLGTAFLHWTMQVFLERNLLIRLVKLVVLPIYIPIAVVGPPLLIALGIWYFIRRVEIVFWVVLYIGILAWGFCYMLPPIIENWGWLMKFVEDFGAV
jgi:hypothetical protein